MSHVLSHTWALTVSRMRLAMRNRAFLFFSLIMPLAFLFIYAGIFGRGRAQAVPYLLAEVLALTVMGSFWGLSVQLVTFREQGHLAPVPCDAGGRERDARLEPDFKLFSDAAHDCHRVLSCRARCFTWPGWATCFPSLFW